MGIDHLRNYKPIAVVEIRWLQYHRSQLIARHPSRSIKIVAMYLGIL